MLYSSPWSNGPAVTSEMFVRIWESLNAAYVKFGGDGYFPTKITSPTFHEDMKNYSVWGRSYYACCFFIHIHNSDAYCSSHKMLNLNWAYLTNHKLDPYEIWTGMHNIMKNNRGKFQLNQVQGFRENGHHHL